MIALQLKTLTPTSVLRVGDYQPTPRWVTSQALVATTGSSAPGTTAVVIFRVPRRTRTGGLLLRTVQRVSTACATTMAA